MALRKILLTILTALLLAQCTYCTVIAQIGTEVEGEMLLSSEVRSTVQTESPTNHTLVFPHLDRRLITRVVIEYENMADVTTVSSMNYANDIMQVTLMAINHNILTVQVTMYGFFEPRANPIELYLEPVFKTVPTVMEIK